MPTFTPSQIERAVRKANEALRDAHLKEMPDSPDCDPYRPLVKFAEAFNAELGTDFSWPRVNRTHRNALADFEGYIRSGGDTEDPVEVMRRTVQVFAEDLGLTVAPEDSADTAPPRISHQYGVQAAAFSDGIHVGRLTADGTSFKDKEDHLDAILAAVAEYTLARHNGSMVVDLTSRVGKPNLSMTITVTTGD